jgi:fructokinase
VINQGVAWDEITLDALPIPSPQLLYYGTLAQRTPVNRATLDRMLGVGAPHRFFDINLRQRFYSEEIVVRGLQRATIVKLNDDEWAVMSQMTGTIEPMQVVNRFGLQALIITRGEHGADLYDRSGHIHATGPEVTVIDAVGAGDAFSAAIAAAAIRSNPMAQALQVACEVGAYVVTVRGAQTVLPAQLANAFNSE